VAPDRPGERINRFLAGAGYGSRRAVEQLVTAGRVTVNGTVERSLSRRIAPGDAVAVDGQPVASERPVYLLLHKPRGVVTTASDPQGRPTVLDLVRRPERVFPVGRLDRDTTGALLLTNDGDLAHVLAHPRHGVAKAYRATVRGAIGDDALQALRDGIELDGRRTAPAEVRLVSRGPQRSVVDLVLHEGRNRQVRRMCEAVGHPVQRLVRVRIGPLTDRRLRPGTWRELTSAELRALEEAVSAPR
jgi:pseudouridine synthase